MNLSESTLLLTRPRPAALRFARQVEQSLGRAGRVVIAPLMRVEPTEAQLSLAPGDTVAFTSESAVRIAAARLRPAGRIAWCVGPRTGEAARDCGFAVHVASGTVGSLADTIVQGNPAGTVWHLAGRHRAGDLAGLLQRAGLRAETRTIYDQMARPLDPEARAVLDAPGDVLVPVFSPRSGQLLADCLGDERARLHVAAISAAAAAPLSRYHCQLADSPDAEGMLRALGRLIAAERFA